MEFHDVARTGTPLPVHSLDRRHRSTDRRRLSVSDGTRKSRPPNHVCCGATVCTGERRPSKDTDTVSSFLDTSQSRVSRVSAGRCHVDGGLRLYARIRRTVLRDTRDLSEPVHK